MGGRRGDENCDGTVRELADEGLFLDVAEYLDGDVSGDSVYGLLGAGGVRGTLPQGWVAFASFDHGAFHVSVVPSDFDLPWAGDAARASGRGVSMRVTLEKCGTRVLVVRTGSSTWRVSTFPSDRRFWDPTGLRETTNAFWEYRSRSPVEVLRARGGTGSVLRWGPSFSWKASNEGRSDNRLPDR